MLRFKMSAPNYRILINVQIIIPLTHYWSSSKHPYVAQENISSKFVCIYDNFATKLLCIKSGGYIIIVSVEQY